MHPLGQHEMFEMEILDLLNRSGLMSRLVFGGGTMLRLCHGLKRYSVDLDFWFTKTTRYELFYNKLLNTLKVSYDVTDSQNKHFTLLVEIRSKAYPRKLKIEIRKKLANVGHESQIAFSSFSNTQVLVPTFSLEEMGEMKIQAMVHRTEIRDFFDFEFLLRRGVAPELSDENKKTIQAKVRAFKKLDYSVSLGSLLERDLREQYIQSKFSYLEQFLARL